MIICTISTPVCYRPAIFVHRLRLIALSVQHGKFRRNFQKLYYFNFLNFSKIFQAWKLRNFKLHNTSIAFTPFVWPPPIKTIFILCFLFHSSVLNHWSEDNIARRCRKILRIFWILFTRSHLSSSSSDSTNQK